MTRERLRRKLSGTYLFLGTVLGIAAFARFAYPLQDQGSDAYKVLFACYEYLKDMSLLIATGGVAYLTDVYQKRSGFIEALKAEWRDVLAAKSALLAFSHIERPSVGEYYAAFNVLSETIDNMRTVYSNVGETSDLVGLYPYAPLHDMRRAFQTLNPQKDPAPSEEQRKLVRDTILQSFYALRERFLDELDLEEPTNPLLAVASWRRKKSGSARYAKRRLERQRKQLSTTPAPNAAIDVLLKQLDAKEASTPKPWRDVEASGTSQRTAATMPASDGRDGPE